MDLTPPEYSTWIVCNAATRNRLPIHVGALSVDSVPQLAPLPPDVGTMADSWAGLDPPTSISPRIIVCASDTEQRLVDGLARKIGSLIVVRRELQLQHEMEERSRLEGRRPTCGSTLSVMGVILFTRCNSPPRSWSGAGSKALLWPCGAPANIAVSPNTRPLALWWTELLRARTPM